jgi:MFS family permease
VFAVGLAAFTVGSLLCGVAGSGLALIGFRALQGIGGAAVFATSLALLAQTFEGHGFGIALGIWSAVVTLGLGCGPVLGGLLADHDLATAFAGKLIPHLRAVALRGTLVLDTSHELHPAEVPAEHVRRGQSGRRAGPATAGQAVGSYSRGRHTR